MNERSEELTIDLRKLLFQIWQNKIIIILVTLVFAMAGFLIATFVVAPTYNATANLVVNNRNDVENTNAISYSDLNASNQLINTYSVILKAHTVLEQVIEDCDLDYGYEALSRMISVTPVNETLVMKVTVTAGSSEEALAIVTDLVRLAPDAIMNSVEAGSVRVVDQPWTTGNKVGPSRKKYTMIGGALGVLLCLAVILIRELTNDKFKTPEDVRTVLDLNVLGVVPEETADKVRKAQSRKKKRKVKKA